MATLRFLDPPKAPDQAQRDRRPEDDLRAARSAEVARLVAWGLGIAGFAVFALVVTAGVLMMTTKQAWISSLRAPYAVEKLTLLGGPGRADELECWTGSTVHLVASIKHQKPESQASSTVTVTLTGELDSAPRPWTVEQTRVLPASALPRVGDTVDVPFAVDVPAWMANGMLVWTVEAAGNGDEASERGSHKITIEPCGRLV